MERQQSYDSLQYYRAYASIIVAGSHSSFGKGYFGVDLFFAISGFVMGMLISREGARASDFLRTRFTRVAPPYYLFMAIAVALSTVILVPTIIPHSQITATRVLESLTFFNVLHEAPLYAIGWTLNFEFVFYTVCTVIMLFAKTGRRRVLAAALATILVSVCGCYWLPDHAYGDLLEFVIGLGVFALRDEILRYLKSAICVVPLLIAGIAIPWILVNFDLVVDWPRGLNRVVSFGPPSMLLLIAAVWAENSGMVPKIRFLRAVGDASYTIYLIHCIVLALCAKAFEIPYIPETIIGGSVVAVAVLVSLPVHRWVEVPLITFARRALARKGMGRVPATGIRVSHNSRAAAPELNFSLKSAAQISTQNAEGDSQLARHVGG